MSRFCSAIASNWNQMPWARSAVACSATGMSAVARSPRNTAIIWGAWRWTTPASRSKSSAAREKLSGVSRAETAGSRTPSSPLGERQRDRRAELRRARSHPEAVRLHDLRLLRRAIAFLRDDGARMAHAPPFRRGQSRHIPDHGFLHVLLDPFGCFSLLWPADLADHDHYFGVRVLLE